MEEKTEPAIPSNEDIINDLTKDLESSCMSEQSVSSTNADSMSKDNKDSNSGEHWPTGEETDEKSDADHEEDPSVDPVDEEALKDREVTLSDDDKQKLRTKAEELKNEGNAFFKAGEYAKAEASYTEGLQTCPLAFAEDRAVLYANRAAARMSHTDNREPAIEDCTKAIELKPTYLKAYLRRAQLLEKESKLDNALADFKKILELDPSHSEANHAVRRLPPLIEEANEKLKAEMLGKLKDLGNLVLKPFGLSTSNFQLQQDPVSGGYSVKFNQNPS